MWSWFTSPSRSRDLALLAVVTTLAYLMVGGHQALGSSTRYDESCREMVELGEWLIPQLGYVPYLEKPPLLYWLGALTRWLFGDSHLAAHLPSGLAALISVLATYALGLRLRDRAFGLAGALALLGSAVFLAMSGTLITDTILSACLIVAWWMWYEWDVRRRGSAPGRAWLFGFWCALACGFLAKGPVAVAIAGAGIGGYALLAGGARGMCTTLWEMRPFSGMAILVALNLPWTLAVWWRDPRLLEFFYLDINLAAFVAGSYNHPGPWWYYLPTMLGMLAPYTVIAVPALLVAMWRAMRRAPWWTPPVTAAEPARLFLAACCVFPLVLLSVSSSKLGTYVLPLVPVCLLLVGDVLRESPHATRRWWAGIVGFKTVLLLLVLAVGPWLAVALHESAENQQALRLVLGSWTWTVSADRLPSLAALNWDYALGAAILLALLTLALLASLVMAVLGRLGWSLALVGIGCSVAVAVGLHSVDDLVRDLDSSRLITVIRAHGGDDPSLPPAQREAVILHQSVVHDYELLYALRRRTFILDGARELGLGHFIEVRDRSHPLPRPGQPIANPYEVSGDTLPGHPWLLSRADFAARWRSAERCWLIGEDVVVHQLRAAGLPFVQVDNARNSLLFTNHPLSTPTTPAPVAGGR